MIIIIFPFVPSSKASVVLDLFNWTDFWTNKSSHLCYSLLLGWWLWTWKLWILKPNNWVLAGFRLHTLNATLVSSEDENEDKGQVMVHLTPVLTVFPEQRFHSMLGWQYRNVSLSDYQNSNYTAEIMLCNHSSSETWILFVAGSVWFLARGLMRIIT